MFVYEELGMVYISTKYDLLTFHARCYFCVFTVISDIIKNVSLHDTRNKYCYWLTIAKLGE